MDQFYKYVCWVLGFFLAMLTSGCSSGSAPTPDHTKTIRPEAAPSGQLLSGAASYNDQNGQQLGSGQFRLTRPADTHLSLRVESDGYTTARRSISFDEDETLIIELTPAGPKMVTVRFTATDTTGAAIAVDSLKLADRDSVVARRPREDEVTLPEAAAVDSLCAYRSGFRAEQNCVQLIGANQSVRFTLTPVLPKAVTLAFSAYEATDHDQAVTLETLTYRHDGDTSTDSVVATQAASGQLTLPFHQRGQLCGRPASSLYADDPLCGPVTADGQPITLAFVRQTVTVNVGVTTEDGSEVENPTITVGDYTYKSGETSHAFAARNGERTVSASAEGFKRQAKEISAEKDQDVSFSLSRIYACNDGKDNDGDGVADEEDSGCVDADGNYDPTDDVERTRVAQISFPGTKGDTTFISGAKGHQEGALGIKDELPAEEINASVSITFTLGVLVSAQQSGEAFAFRLETGSSKQELNTVNTTAVAADEGHDGWKNAVFDVPKEFFKNGSFYQAYVVHAVKVRGQPATEGDDDVIFRTPEKVGVFYIKIEYEPEEVE